MQLGSFTFDTVSIYNTELAGLLTINGLRFLNGEKKRVITITKKTTQVRTNYNTSH